MAVIEAKTEDEIRKASHSFLAGVVELYNQLRLKHANKLTPTYDNLKGTYEEAWCNLRNKVLNSVAEKDKSYAFLAAMGAQSYFDEMTEAL